MQWLTDLFTSVFLVIPIITWAIAQLVKIIIEAILSGKFDFKRIFGDGGMPSAHCATVSSLAMVAALEFGAGSFEFALAAIFAVIVCRDAVGVRQETGKQAVVLGEIVETLQDMTAEKLTQVRLQKFVGHTPWQVFAGVGLGVVSAALLHLLF